MGGQKTTEREREQTLEGKCDGSEGMEWMDEMDGGGGGGDREESGHRIFEGGNDLACTFSEGRGDAGGSQNL